MPTPMVMRKGIEKAVEAAVAAIKEHSVPVNSSEDIAVSAPCPPATRPSVS